MDRREANRVVDAHVGNAIRRRRRAMGVSQQGLAEHLGISFQQVQKYENGANRISASVLYETAAALAAPIESFFEGLTPATPRDPAAAARQGLMAEMLTFPGGFDLARWFLSLNRPGLRNSLLIIARELAALEAEGATGQDRA